MSKHTPGPWKWKSDLDMGGFHIYMDTAIRNRSGYQCHHHLELDFTLYPEDGDQWEEAKANARLIAAAPDLLAALVKAERLFREIGFIAAADSARPESLWNEINNAISKATGGAQ